MTVKVDKINGQIRDGNVYTFQYSHLSLNPNPSTAYYMGGRTGAAMTAGAMANLIYVPKKGTITAVQFTATHLAGSNQKSNLYVRVNDTTDYLVSPNVDNSVSLMQVFAQGLNIAVNAGDFIEIKWVTPAWTSSPTNMRPWGMVAIEY